MYSIQFNSINNTVGQETLTKSKPQVGNPIVEFFQTLSVYIKTM